VGTHVTISARIKARSAVSSALLAYHVGAGTEQTVNMLDNGNAGDLIAGDGIYTGVIPAQNSACNISYHVSAADGSAAARFPTARVMYPNDSEQREAYVRVGETIGSGDFATYRLWFSPATYTKWSELNNGANGQLRNAPFNVTFVYNNERVVHAAGAYYSGSPAAGPLYDTPDNKTCGYNLIVPKDQQVLGAMDFVLDWPARDAMAQREQVAYWIAEQVGQPFNYRRFVHLHVNGRSQIGRPKYHSTAQNGMIYEDAQQPGADFVKSWFPTDSDGTLIKLEGMPEYRNNNSGTVWYGETAGLFKKTRGSGKKTEYYRWTWLKRAVSGDLNDYSTVYELIDAADLGNDSQLYTTTIGALIDIDNWMSCIAMNRITISFDTWGYANNHNMYLYKPERGRWKLLLWDLDFGTLGALHDANNDGLPKPPSDNPSGSPMNDPVLGRVLDHPPFQRAFWRAALEVANGPLVSTTFSPIVDANNAALNAAVTGAQDSSSLKTWMADRRTFVLGKLNSAPSLLSPVLSITSNGGADITTSDSVYELQGKASVQVKYIAVNGTVYHPQWTTVTDWRIPIHHWAGQHRLDIEGRDSQGTLVPNASATINITFEGAGPAWAPIIINEFMANNGSTIRDPADQDFDDWIELYNPGIRPVDLAGWTLTDNPNVPARWTFPTTGSVIPAGGYLLIWADNEITQSGLHANFSLNAGGEAIRLYPPQSTTYMDALTFGPQTQDVSHGCWPDGSSDQLGAVRVRLGRRDTGLQQ
jgi:hypothetical protein